MLVTIRPVHGKPIAAALLAAAFTLMILLSAGCGGATAPPPPDPVAPEDGVVFQAGSPAVIHDPTVDGFLGQVSSRLMSAAQQKDAHSAPRADFVLVAAPGVINCTTLGAGHVYATADLFQFCRNEEELAAALAHAYAHVCLRQGHVSNEVTSADRIVLANKAGFTPTQEEEADRLAYEMYARAGWDISRFDDLYQHLIEAGLDSSGGELRQRAMTPQMVRLPAASRDWEKRPVADDVRFQQYKRRVVELARTGDHKSQILFASLPNCMTGVEQTAQRDARNELVNLQQTGGPQNLREGHGGNTVVVPGEGGQDRNNRR